MRPRFVQEKDKPLGGGFVIPRILVRMPLKRGAESIAIQLRMVLPTYLGVNPEYLRSWRPGGHPSAALDSTRSASFLAGSFQSGRMKWQV